MPLSSQFFKILLINAIRALWDVCLVLARVSFLPGLHMKLYFMSKNDAGR